MPSVLHVTVHGARSLPVMDQRSKLADAYVEVAFGSQAPRRTPVVRKTLNPSFNTAFKFEIADDAELLIEPLVCTVIDKDFFTDDSIGSVLLSLEPLLAAVPPSASASSSSAGGTTGRWRELGGWFPIYDTLEGVRGELHVSVRLRFFGDGGGAAATAGDGGPTTNAPAALGGGGGGGGSGGVAFFSLSRVDAVLFPTQCLLAFVEELIVEEDPEYAAIDSFRTARKSNEHRQLLLFRLAYGLRGSIGKKVRAVGGNAVLGYQQHFDVEGDSGIVGRAYGTAVRLGGPRPGVSAGYDLARLPRRTHYLRVSARAFRAAGAEAALLGAAQTLDPPAVATPDEEEATAVLSPSALDYDGVAAAAPAHTPPAPPIVARGA